MSKAGWLLPQFLELERALWSRYPVWQHALRTGELFAPSPIDFAKIGTPPFDRGIAAVLNVVRQFSGEEYPDRDTLADLSIWLLWSLGHPAFAETPSKLPVETIELADLEPWISNPADYLGHLLTQYGRANRTTAFFPTFQPCADLMVRFATQVTIAHSELVPPYHGYDPALGTGRLALSASNVCRSLSGWELNRSLLTLALLNFTLFAPDFAYPLCSAGDLILGDSLTGEGRSLVQSSRRYASWAVQL